MDSDEPTSPPSRRHRPSRRRKKSKQVLPPPLEQQDKQANSEALEQGEETRKGNGKAREDPKEARSPERDQKREQQLSKERLDENGQDPLASSSRIAISGSSLTPLKRRPSLRNNPRQPFVERSLSLIFSNNPLDGRIPQTLQSSPQVRRPSHRNDSDSAARSSEHGRSLTSSRKRKQVKRVKSTRANKGSMWSQVKRGFGAKEVENEKSSEDEEDIPDGSIDRFKHDLLPLSTAREQRRQGQREAMDDDPASQYDLVQPDPRRPLKRFSTFMGGEDLDCITEENHRRLLRRPPYRTISTDAQQLDFVSPSDALLGATYDRTSLRRRRQITGREDKVKRLAPGKTPRIPFLHNLDQTGFAIRSDQSTPPNMYSLTDLMVSDQEVARLTKQGSGWVSTKRKRRGKFVSKKAGLEMVREEEAIDTAKIDPTFLHEPVKVKKRRKSIPKKPPAAKDEFRFIPRRLPAPVRPFARRPPPVLVPEPRLTESIQTASAPKSAPLLPDDELSPSLPRPPPKAIEPTFRFIVGTKANRAPTVLVADTPSITEAVTRPKRHLTFSSPLPGQAQEDHNLRSSHLREDGELSRPKKKQKLMRRLSTVPDFNLTNDRQRDEIEVIIEPEPTFNQYAKSSHSNSQHSSHHPAEPSASRRAPSYQLTDNTVSLAPAPHQAEPVASFHPSSQQPQFNDSNDYFSSSSSSFERDVLGVLDSNNTEQQLTRSSTRNYIAQLQNQQQIETEQEQSDPVSSGRWWIGGPTVSAARGTAESEVLPFPYRGGVQSDGTMIGYDDGEETEVVDSSMIATLGAGGARGGEEVEGEGEEPPGSILQGLED